MTYFDPPEEFERGSAYMLRNDGKLINCSDTTGIHPYIIYYLNDNINESLRLLFHDNIEFFNWFYQNTKSNSTKTNLRQLAIEYFTSDMFKNKSLSKESKVKSCIGDFNRSDSLNLTKEEINDLLILCNNETNQEFCRVRTSSLKFGISNNGIYFRISSVGFNWFDLIWNVVYSFRNRISDVTVCTDTQSRGGRLEYYTHGGVELKRLPVDEFINLTGNPIIESYKNNFYEDLEKGLSLDDTFCTHPRRINQIVNQLWVSDDRSI